jgi:hypothetical protein
MAKYLYVVDLNERGYYNAHVTDAKTEQEVIFEVSNEYTDDGEISMVEDGFMKHGQDMNGLFWYLVDAKLLKADDTLLYRG